MRRIDRFRSNLLSSWLKQATVVVRELEFFMMTLISCRRILEHSLTVHYNVVRDDMFF